MAIAKIIFLNEMRFLKISFFTLPLLANTRHLSLFSKLENCIKSTNIYSDPIFIGSIGAPGNGKTTLTTAISKTLCKTPSKEFNIHHADTIVKQRAISSPYVPYSIRNKNFIHFDCSIQVLSSNKMSHVVSLLDIAILVLSGAKEESPKALKYLWPSLFLGVKHLIIFVNEFKGSSTVPQNEDIEKILKHIDLDPRDVPIVRGSALSSSKEDNSVISHLIQTIDKVAGNIERDQLSSFLMPVDCHFTSQAGGHVVVGRLQKGTLRKHMKSDLIGHGRVIHTYPISLQIFNQEVEEVVAGQNVGVLLEGVSSFVVNKGMILVSSGYLSRQNRFEATVYVLNPEEGGRNCSLQSKCIQRAFSRNWSSDVRIDVLNNEAIIPGSHGKVKVLLHRGMAVSEGDQFVICGNRFIVAVGVVSKLLPFVKGVVGNKLRSLNLEFGES